MIGQGLILMVAGMVTVYVFLIVMIYAINLASSIITKLEAAKAVKAEK